MTCLSTLEHVGFDNSRYSESQAFRENNPDDYLIAIGELRRVLKPGGSLLITLPFGAYQRFQAFQQFDSSRVQRLTEAFQPAHSQETIYRYTSSGWNIASREDAEACRYVEWINRELPLNRPLAVEPDRAAAARAVVCIDLTK